MCHVVNTRENRTRREHGVKSIAQKIEELRRLSTNDLVNRYGELYGKAPRVKNREHVWKRCAWKIQEQRFGGLSGVARRRLDELISEIDLPIGEKTRAVTGALKRPPKPGEPPVGTVLTREWHGREISCAVVENGFECEGVVYRSLTAVANAVTGSRWNGKLFFGLVKRKKAK